MRRLLAHPASGNDDDYDVLAAIDRKRSWAELKSRSAARLPRAILLIQSTGAAGIEAPRVPVRSSFGDLGHVLLSLLEPLSSRSQRVLHLFLVQLLYPSSQSCCVAQKA